MNDFKKNFIQIRHDLSLTDGERAHMRSVLEAAAMPSASVIGGVPSPLYFFTGPMRFAGAFALLLVVITGGSSALADEALPGDALYSVKIHLNENVERTLARNTVAKASVDIKHAEERLTEVELLAASGKADEALTKVAAENMEEKVAAASSAAQELADAGDEAAADSIHTRINTTLLAHADILDAQAEDLEEGAGQTLRALSVAVTFAADEATQKGEEDTAPASTDEDPEVLAAELALAREAGAKSRIDALIEALADEQVPEETKTLLSVELASIEADYGLNRGRMIEEEYEEAAREYREIERRSYRAFAALESARRITEETGKEVIVAVNVDDVRPEFAIAADATTTAEAEPVLMKAALFSTEATSTEPAPQLRAKRPERALQFWVHDRMGE